jgi:hypothetical protein
VTIIWAKFCGAEGTSECQVNATPLLAANRKFLERDLLRNLRSRPENHLIVRRQLGVINYKHVNRHFSRLQLQPQLLLQRREQRRALRT